MNIRINNRKNILQLLGSSKTIEIDFKTAKVSD